MNACLVKAAGDFPFAAANERQCNLCTRTSLNFSLNRDRQIELDKLYQSPSLVSVARN